MKTLWTIFCCTSMFFISTALYGQTIPNSNFEAWEITNDIEDPIGWSTNNYFSFSSMAVVKTEEAYEGNYAIAVSAKVQGFEGNLPGIAETKFSIEEGVPAGLKAWVKCIDILDTGYCQIILKVFNGNTVVSENSWQSSDSIVEWTSLYIPIEINDGQPADSMSITFIGSSILTPLFSYGDATLVVDAINLDFTNSVSSPESLMVEVFPNPAIENILLSSNKNINSVQVWNSTGQLVFNQNQINAYRHQIPIQHLTKGLYILSLKDEEGSQILKRFVKN